MSNNHWQGALVIIVSNVGVAYPLKNPNNTCQVYNSLQNTI